MFNLRSLLVLALVSTGFYLQADDRFVRISKTDDGKFVSMDTSVVTYTNKDKNIRIDLISVTHLGERDYYKALDKKFEDYDVVLYELVSKRNMKPKRDGTPHPIRDVFKDILQLEHQLEQINYNKDNFVHADLTPKELGELFKKRIGGVIGDFFDIMRESMKGDASPPPNINFPKILEGNKEEGMKLKRYLAEEMVRNMEDMMEMDKAFWEILIEERNKKALEIMSQQVIMGNKNIAIFYGAGHMCDFDRKLRLNYGMKPIKTEWFSAWKLSSN